MCSAWRSSPAKCITRTMHSRPLPIVVALILASSTMAMTRLQMAAPGANEPLGEWRGYAGSNAGLKYSPLDQINKDNVKNLRIAWRQSAMPAEVRRGAEERGRADQLSGDAADGRMACCTCRRATARSPRSIRRPAA